MKLFTHLPFPAFILFNYCNKFQLPFESHQTLCFQRTLFSAGLLLYCLEWFPLYFSSFGLWVSWILILIPRTIHVSKFIFSIAHFCLSSLSHLSRTSVIFIDWKMKVIEKVMVFHCVPYSSHAHLFSIFVLYASQLRYFLSYFQFIILFLLCLIILY